MLISDVLPALSITWGEITAVVTILITILTIVWNNNRRFNKKASKEDLTKLEKNMQEKANRIEKRTMRETDLIRKETIQILQPMRDQINTIFNWLKPDGE